MSSERPSASLSSSTRLTVLQLANSIATGALPMWPITPTHTQHPPVPQPVSLPAAAMAAAPAMSSAALWGGFQTSAASAPLMEFPSAHSLSREPAPHSNPQNHLAVSVSSFSALQAELAASKPLNHFPGFTAPVSIAAPTHSSFSTHTHTSLTLLSSQMQPSTLPLEMSTAPSVSESGDGGRHSRRNSIHNRSLNSANSLSSPTAAAPAPPAPSSRAFACIHAALNGSTAWLQSSSAAITLMDVAHKSSRQSRNAAPLGFPSIAPSPEQRKSSA